MKSDATKRNSKCIISQIRKSTGKEEADIVKSFFDEALAHIDSDNQSDASKLTSFDILDGLLRSPVSGFYSRLVGERFCEPCVISNAKGEKPCPEVGVFLDLTGFKGINDFLVYQAGDAVLKAFADWLAYNISVTYQALRWLPVHYGGDEFALIGFAKIRPCEEGYQKPPENLTGIRGILRDMRSALKPRYILMRMPFGTKSKASVTCYIPENGNRIEKEESKGDVFTQEENGYIRYIFTGLEYKFSAKETLNDAISSLGEAKLHEDNGDVQDIPRGMIGLSFYWGGTGEVDALINKMRSAEKLEADGFISLLKNIVLVAKVPKPDAEAIKECEAYLAAYIHAKVIDWEGSGNKENSASADTPSPFLPAVTSCYRDGAILFRIDFTSAPEKVPCLQYLSDATKRLELEKILVGAMNSECKTTLLSRCMTISLETK